MTTAQPAAAADCGRAEQLTTLDLLAARAEYLKLLESDDPPACARAGFDRVAQRRREVAGLLAQTEDAAALGRNDDAARLIAQVLVLDPANDHGQTLLDDLARDQSPPERPASDFAGASALLNAGYEDEAREEARKIAAEKRIPIPNEFKEPDVSPSDWVKARTEDAAAWAGGLAIGAALFVAAVALLLKFHGWIVRRRFVTLGNFTSQQSGVSNAGEELKTVVGEELANASRTSQTFRVVDAAGVQLPELIDVPEQLAPFAKLIQLLFRRTILTISATARARDGGGWQVTAQINGRRRVLEQETFSVPAAAGAGLHPVGVWVGAWALYGLRANMGWRWRRRTYPFGTANWQSFAWARLAAVGGGAPELKRQRLHQALLHDHRHVAALALLGTEQTLDPADEQSFADGLAHFEFAAVALAERPTRRSRVIRGRPHCKHVKFEPLWFQIAYAHTVALLHRYHDGEASNPRSAKGDDLTAGQDLAFELTRAIASTWLTLTGCWRRFAVNGTRRAELRKMLAWDDEYHLGVLAGALVTTRKKPVTPASVERRTGRRLWKWVAAFADEPEPKVEQLLGMVTSPPSHAHPDTLYNLACVWAQSGHMENALAALRASFEHDVGERFADNLHWAETDPTLQPLRNDEAWGPKLRGLLEELKQRLPKPSTPPSTAHGTGDRWTVELLAR